MAGSIGNLAEEVLQEVKSDKLVKIAQHKILQEAKPTMHTSIGRTLMKLAVDIRNAPEDVTVGELENFISEADNAS